MGTKSCPKCGEKNPPEAVMCWACYTDLALPSRVQKIVWKAAALLGISPYARASRASRRAARLAAGQDPIERIFDTILQYATRDEVSDIYLEPQEKGLRILYRIDGEVQEQMKVPIYVFQPLISHIKAVAKMGTHKDGRSIDFAWDGKSKIWNMSAEATAFGEKLVLSTQKPSQM